MKNLDIFDIGKNTFNSCYSQLQNDKKVLKFYSQHIEEYLNSIEEHINILQSINRNIDKNLSIDKPFCFLKKFEIILNLQCNYFDNLIESSQKSFEHLKDIIDKTLKIISNFLLNTQISKKNIKIKSEEFYEKFNNVEKYLEQTEMSIIDDYIQTTYNIQIINYNDKTNNTEELVNESHKHEKSFLISKQNMKDIFKNFLNEYNLNMKEIKIGMTKLNEECKNELVNIIKIIKDGYNNLYNLLDDAMTKIENFDKNNKNFENGYSEYLNNEIKEEELFNILDEEKYKIKIIKEEEKNLLEKENSQSQKNNSNNNKKSHNLLINAKDIYNIVEKIYSYNFETIDKNDYILSDEKNKLEILNFASKLLGYDFLTNKLTKMETLSQEEINNFITLILSKEVYLIEFLKRLNNFRTTGKFELSLDLFNFIKTIFDKAADNLLIKQNSTVSNFLIILSQTFYIIKDEQKYFLQKEVNKKEYFRKVDFWYNKLDNSISQELERFEEDIVENKIDLNENAKKRKKEDIIFVKFVSFITSLNGFEIEKEKIDKIIFPLFDKYNIKEEMRKSILPLFNVYKDNK